MSNSTSRPGIDGYPDAGHGWSHRPRAIREELGLGTLPVIALTTRVLAEEKQNALGAGVNDFLPKPMDLDLMASMIRSYCPASG